MLFKILYLLRGYIVIQIRGCQKEKLINYLIRSNFIIWDIKEVDDHYLAKLVADDFKRIRESIRRADCTVRIRSRHGLPFFLKKLKVRNALVIGLVVAVITIYILSSFIWTVELNGLEDIKEEEIFFLLNKAGFEYGMLKYNLNTEEVEDLINQNEKVAWVDVKVNGTKLLIDLVEKTTVEGQNIEGQAIDLVAEKSGLITEVIVLEGEAVVEEGTIVQAGDRLISGTIKHYSEPEVQEEVANEEDLDPVEIEKVVAKGIVKAKVWYESYGEVNLTDYYQQQTTDVVESFSIKYEDQEFHIFGPKKPPFVYFKVEKTIKSLPSWRNIDLPIEIIRRRYIKIKEFSEKRSLAEAKKIAKERALQKVLTQLDDDAVILDKDLKLISTNQEENNIVRVKALVTTKENIALQENIQ
ncbi:MULTISPECIES: sporulation protein YqfD [unclassified Candidatus Frackibacter]|uniref:sporulation protein YqfD n=1 Tax=unclassified Candidatus Frackibacter TaxID=2648818 RepID=UPI00088A2870|nr:MULTISPECIES: sporulation protein YqfD [unclassified Candidatus Frackibacter]SDC73993.1 similar to stage IV sporulation protein [Candidatus Frackibacter sp. WG11]SEM88054.1 similar to stage IV sporulation protein [Candidatus Frackibacter sp. WG12]SFL97407.1 similar to stage IV sporulation protein [Candidatus Frackibacter sp. WG13]